MGVNIKKRGAVAKGNATKVLDGIVEDASVDIAEETLNRIRARLNQVLRHPTGFYESRVTVTNVSDSVVISDGGVVYGPWLEGTGSRNNTTRFKGYHTFRIVSQDMAKQAEQIADRAISSNLGRLG